jgi:hypothetical protein
VVQYVNWVAHHFYHSYNIKKIESPCYIVIHGFHLVLYTQINCKIMHKLSHNHSMSPTESMGQEGMAPDFES